MNQDYVYHVRYEWIFGRNNASLKRYHFILQLECGVLIDDSDYYQEVGLSHVYRRGETEWGCVVNATI